MIVTQHIIAMIEHWLSTPPNAYIGSRYGAPLNDLILNRLSAPVGNAFIAKMKTDIPILNQLGPDQLSLYSDTEGHETRIIYLRVGNVNINLNKAAEVRAQLRGETFDVNAV